MLCVMVRGLVNLTGLFFSSQRWMPFEIRHNKASASLVQDGAARVLCDEQTGKPQPAQSSCQFCFPFSGQPEQTVLLALEKMVNFRVSLFPPTGNPVAHLSQPVAFTAQTAFQKLAFQ